MCPEEYSPIKELEFCFKYLNFYIGLLSALVAATLTGLLQFTLPHPRGLLLLLGPLLVIVLAVVGYKTVRVFYRRYMEAWITSLNVDEMLGLRTTLTLGPGVRPPRFKSKFHGGFITEFERRPVRKRLEQATQENWPAETLLNSVLKIGDTLRFAWWTFAVFIGAALVTAAATLRVVLAQQ